MIEVVAGIVVRDGRILLAQRPGTKDFPFTWECPGGKVDGNESHHQALRRELDEELGLEVGDICQSSTWCGEFESGHVRPERRRIHLLFYRVLTFTGPPMSNEGQGFGWFTGEEMTQLTLAPGNKKAWAPLWRSAFGKEA